MAGSGRVVWHECVTSDVEAASRFYGELLGWETETWKPGEMDYVMIAVDGAMHGGYQTTPPDTPSHWFGHIAVDDCDAAVERALARGARLLAGPVDLPEVGRFALISDPQGAVVSFFRPEGEGPVAAGVFAWDELIADDADAAAAFYIDVVGWETASMNVGTGPYTIFEASGVGTAGLMGRPEGMPGRGASWTVYAACTDVDGAVVRVPDLGGAVIAAPFDVPTVGRIAVIADPTGAVMGLFQPLSA